MGVKVQRKFTQAGKDVYSMFKYEKRDSVLKDISGKVISEIKDVEVPKQWSQVATDILAQKYFRKRGVPKEFSSDGMEHSVKQVVHRLAYTWRYFGEKFGYFASEEDAQAFYDELVYMMLAQMAAPNSPQWFNTGLYHVYGIKGRKQGHWYVDENGNLKKSGSAYERPQVHACFILSVEDDLLNEGGIMDLWLREARIFKYGSGTGTNFSTLRGKGEPLSGGGTSSGVMSFLKIGDAVAGAIKSGGTTRRAAKMVILDIDHPDVEDFIVWKAKEEQKARALVAAGYSVEEALETISGQNANNSVRITDKFFEVLDKDGYWELIGRVDGKPLKKVKASKLWDDIAKAAWECADPGLQFHDTINAWHTCPADGEIRASNPCSEYMFLDNTACNLASLNLLKFYDVKKQKFDVESFLHAVRLWTIVLDISVSMAQYPDKQVAYRSYLYRTLGLGYANLGALLMAMALPYDSEEGRLVAGAISALLTGGVYLTSTELAKELGTFPRYEANKEHVLRVMRNHMYAALGQVVKLEKVNKKSHVLNDNKEYQYLIDAARDIWKLVVENGEKYGFRNAQATAIAPTGTIGLLMDCDTTGIEPDFALVKFKKLVGGGYFKIVNKSVPLALKKLGYSNSEIKDIVEYIVGTGTLKHTPHINYETLKQKGFTDEDLKRLDEALKGAFHIKDIFTVWTLGEETLKRLGFKPEDYNKPDFNLLKALGFSDEEINEASLVACGRQTIEGAPHLKEEHYPVFDCAVPSPGGKRFLRPEAHVLMMAAVQPFISGAISKTVNMPNQATVDDVKDIYRLAWEQGLKAIAIYRDGSKVIQPLSTTSSEEKETQDSEKLKPYTEKRRLPARRYGITWKAKIAGQSIFIRTGEYEDGRIGELFIDMYKEGASFRSLLNSFAIAVSIGLQHGVPLEEFVDKFIFTKFDPAGPVQHPYIKHTTSVLDFIFRLLAAEYLGRVDLLHVKPPLHKLRINEIKNKTNNLSESGNLSEAREVSISTESLEPPHHHEEGESEAEICPVCGNVMIRTGTCYTCPNCGTTSGCA